MHIRLAEPKDISLIYDFITLLADYEKMTNEVVASIESLKDWLFVKKVAEVIFIVEDEKEVGFALYFYHFSTFLGKAGIYLEDIFIKPDYRGRGFGKAVFKYLSSTAIQRGCGRLEWSCLNWNEPSIQFYLSLGAIPMDEWTVYRLTEEKMRELM